MRNKKGLRPNGCNPFFIYGADTRNRTEDLLITSQLLYQLSYVGVVEARIISKNWICASLFLKKMKFFCVADDYRCWQMNVRLL
jgi:hypothetical protein